MQALKDSRVCFVLSCLMAVGLFVQLTGKILYASGSANGAHVYMLLIIPSLIVFIWLMWQRFDFLSKEVITFLFSAILFLIVCSISSVWGGGGFSLLLLLKRSLILFFYLTGVIFLISIFEVKQIKIFLLAVSIVVAIGAISSIWYHFFVLEKSFGWRSFRISNMGYRDWIDLGNPVIAGVYLSTFGVLSLALAGLERPVIRFIALFTLVALLSYIFLTFSRTSWVGGLVAGIFLLYTIRSRTLVWVAIIAVLVILAISGLYLEELINEVTHQQFSGRGATWLWAVEHLGENIILGHGYGHTFWEESHYVHAHNFYLQVIYEQGLIGLLTLLAMLFIVCRCYWKNRRDSLVSLGFSLVVFLMVIMLSEIDHVITRPGVYWTIFWFPLAFTLGAVNRIYLQEKSELSPGMA